MVRITGKRALMETLKAEGVDYIFGNPGTSESAIMDTLADYPEIRYMLGTQEGVAMGMADGYSLATGRPSFVNLHIETGLANGISLLHHAWEGGVPIILTAGNKDVRKLPQGRTKLSEMVSMFTKWSVEATSPDQLAGALRRAFNEAKTPPTGPVFVGFSANSLDDEGDVDIYPSSEKYTRVGADVHAVAKAADILGMASNPVILVGDRLGRSNGASSAAKLAELVGARVYALSYAEMNFPTGHPQFLGMIDLTFPDGRSILSDADVILVIGASAFPGFFYIPGRNLPKDARLIHVDSSSNEVGKSEPTEVGIVADPKTAVDQIVEAVESSMSGLAKVGVSNRIDSLRSHKIRAEHEFQISVNQSENARPMSPYIMMREVSKYLPADVIIADDSITSRGAIHSAMEFNEPGSIYSERGGAIGWGIGSAMGIKLAHPHRPVVGIVGDGSAMMTVQGLWTAANYNIAVVYIICNNRSYRILKLNMDRYRKYVLRDYESSDIYPHMDFRHPFDMAGLANAMGVFGCTVENPDELGPAIGQCLNMNKPALIDVVIDGAV